MSEERKALSKRTRFEIFKRDGFRCHYCGATPQDLPLHVDHVKPVAEGGTDDPWNLITACRDCNGGKSAVPLEQRKFKTEALTEADRDHAEQIREYLAVQREVHEARAEVAGELVNLWIAQCATEPHALASRLGKAAREFGFARVVEAIEATAVGCTSRSGADQLRYFYGILRNWRTRDAARPESPEPRPTEDAKIIGECRAAIAKACREVDASFAAKDRRFTSNSEIRRHIARAFLNAARCPSSTWVEAESRAYSTWGSCDALGFRLTAEDRGDGRSAHGVAKVRDHWHAARELLRRDMDPMAEEDALAATEMREPDFGGAPQNAAFLWTLGDDWLTAFGMNPREVA